MGDGRPPCCLVAGCCRRLHLSKSRKGIGQKGVDTNAFDRSGAGYHNINDYSSKIKTGSSVNIFVM